MVLKQTSKKGDINVVKSKHTDTIANWAHSQDLTALRGLEDKGEFSRRLV